MTRFNQNAVVDQLNVYLKSQNRKMFLEYGYCHGFSLLWLYKMSEGKEAWFYHFIKNLVAAKSPTDFDYLEMDIEKFIAHIEWLQNSSTYAPQIQQLDLESVLEIPEKTSLSSVLSPRQFDDIIELIAQPNQMICLSCPTHTIGLFQRGKNYYLFDPNYNEGEAKAFTDKKLLAHEIVKCLFKNLSIPTMKIALEINIVTNPDIKMKHQKIINKTEFLQQVATSCEQVNGVDDFGMGSLYLACENHDMKTAEFLLSRGALPNQQRKDGETPLFTAALRGYADLVYLLLEHGAKTQLTDNNGTSPLLAAVENNFPDVIKTLLQHGANSTHSTKNIDSPFTHAIQHKKWNLFLLMLPFVKEKEIHVEMHREQLNQHKQDIMQTFLETKKTRALQENKELLRLLKQTWDEPKSKRKTLEAPAEHTKNRYRFFPYAKNASHILSADNTSEPVLQQFTPNV
jgi:hypothetical protein